MPPILVSSRFFMYYKLNPASKACVELPLARYTGDADISAMNNQPGQAILGMQAFKVGTKWHYAIQREAGTNEFAIDSDPQMTKWTSVEFQVMMTLNDNGTTTHLVSSYNIQRKNYDVITPLPPPLLADWRYLLKRNGNQYILLHNVKSGGGSAPSCAALGCYNSPDYVTRRRCAELGCY